MTPLAKLIDVSLLAVSRKPRGMTRSKLIALIEKEVTAFLALQPHVGPHAEKLRRFAEVAGSLQKAIEDAHAQLRKLGAHLGTKWKDPRASRDWEMAAYSVGRPLYLLVERQLQEQVPALQRLHQAFHPKGGRPKAFGADLSEKLEYLVCKGAGYQKKDLQSLLAGLSGNFGLPVLSLATLKKRKVRAARK